MADNTTPADLVNTDLISTDLVYTDLAELIRGVEQGVKFKYVFFWGHQPQADGSIGTGCLSQWWPASFAVDGVGFATAEHYMMWRKAMLFGDTVAADEVLRVGHPQEAKAVGRTVRGFEDAVWVANRFDIVTDASVAKFSQNPELGAYLLGTGERVLVEASPRDRIWGIGMGAKNENAANPAQWRGLNLLGFALMRARDVLRKEDTIT
jgi:ribA/ribD-fused uncharacterized protein